EEGHGHACQHRRVLSRLPGFVQCSLDLPCLGLDVARLDGHCLLILQPTRPAPIPATSVVMPRARTLYHSFPPSSSFINTCIPAYRASTPRMVAMANTTPPPMPSPA